MKFITLKGKKSSGIIAYTKLRAITQVLMKLKRYPLSINQECMKYDQYVLTYGSRQMDRWNGMTDNAKTSMCYISLKIDFKYI